METLDELLIIIQQLFRRDATKPSLVLSTLDPKKKNYYGSIVRYTKNSHGKEQKRVVVNSYDTCAKFVLENLAHDLYFLYPKNSRLDKLTTKLMGW